MNIGVFSIKELFGKSEAHINNNINNGFTYNKVGYIYGNILDELKTNVIKSTSINACYDNSTNRHILANDYGDAIINEIKNNIYGYKGYYLTIMLAIKFASLYVYEKCPAVRLKLTLPKYDIKTFNENIISTKSFLSNRLLVEAINHNVYVGEINFNNNHT